MTFFLIRRLTAGLALVVIVTALTALFIYGGGTDIARNIVGNTATEAQVAQRATELGLDRPPIEQYLAWFGGVLHGDMGKSFYNSEPVSQALANRIPVTLSIVIGAVLFTAIVGAFLGVLSAVRRGWIDRVVQVFNVVSGALPTFWVGLVLVAIFAINLKIFPATGYTPPSVDPARWILGLVLPVTALVLGSLGVAAIVRSSVIDVLRLDFVRTLRAHGLSRQEVLYKHVLRNAAPPFLTVISMQFIGLMGGAVVIERVFAIPGLGLLATDSTQRGDVPVVLGVVIVSVLVIVVVNLIVDILSGWLNPKARIV
ncbi:ABC transporter permease [Microbacterium sp. NPDC056044]|uniref:ABC transporter permease n=1 Tax=Microbacterium sp. NPDC056044 TaxID=3345690 RepID=UPI0035D79904